MAAEMSYEQALAKLQAQFDAQGATFATISMSSAELSLHWHKTQRDLLGRNARR